MSVLFVNGLVLDGLADSVVEGWVHVDGERIVGVGPGQPAPRINGRTVDLAGRTIMPGLIDAHVHMAGGDYFPGYEHEAIGIAAVRTVETARRTLLAGFTTVRRSLSPWQSVRQAPMPGDRHAGAAL